MFRRFAATRYVGSQKQSGAELARLRAVNPNYVLLHYRLATASGPPEYIQANGDWGSDWASVTANESWFVHHLSTMDAREYEDAMNRTLPLTQSRVAIVQTNLIDGIAGRHRGFLVGTYFLLQGERTYLNILEDRDVNGMTWYPEYDINLGAPLGPVANAMQTYDLADGVDDAVYRRDFTNGRVIVNDVRVVEGQSGSTLATFTISLSASSTQSVTVSYATVAGTAAAGSDFTASSGQLSFAPGELTRMLSVPALGDTTDESDESFSLVLSSAVNATIADATGVGTITDDEDPPAGQQIVVTDAIDTYLTGVQSRTANLGGAATIIF